MNRPTDLPGRPVQVRRERNPWAAYEAAKRELPKDLTPAERDAALRAIAQRLGV